MIIDGGQPLHGALKVSGAKNAALPLMAAALLSRDTLILTNAPDLADTRFMVSLLTELGVEIDASFGGHGDGDGDGDGVVALRAHRPLCAQAPYDWVRRMRASILVLGPLLARCGEAQVSLPGGCAIGVRPIDLHLAALRRFGASAVLEGGYVRARAPRGGLRGARVVFPSPSVGATANALMAASLAHGASELVGCAREPEIKALVDCLGAMGAVISSERQGAVLHIQGAASLGGARHRVIGDRIEAGSYALAVAACGGQLRADGLPPQWLDSLWRALRDASGGDVSLQRRQNGFTLTAPPASSRGAQLTTAPYPGFPTDLQAQFMAFASIGRGRSVITETVFPHRFMHVAELRRLGADITLEGASAVIRAQTSLTGAEVLATDLRASMSLVLAALAARGRSVINRVYHLDRGYQNLVARCRALGASVTRAGAPLRLVAGQQRRH